jgi:hypothetical protein
MVQDVLVLDFVTTYWRTECLDTTSIRLLRDLGYMIRTDLADLSYPRATEYTYAMEKMLNCPRPKKRGILGANRYHDYL